MDKISVIMSIYNEREEWIRESIESILNQTYKNIEFIIVLDNPNNEIIDNLIKNYCKIDCRIKYLRNTDNIGLANCLNRGLNVATGEFIARMDADDIAVSTRLEVQIAHFRNDSDLMLVGGNVEYIGENSECIEDKKNEKFISDHEYKLNEIVKVKNPFKHPTWLFRKCLVEKVGVYTEFPCSQDYDYISRILAKDLKIKNYNEVVLKYRIRKTSISNDRRLLQYKIARYIKKLYIINRETGKYTFSKERLTKLLSDAEKENHNYNMCCNYIKEAKKEILNKKYVYAFSKIIKGICKYPKYCDIFIYNLYSQKIVEKNKI